MIGLGRRGEVENDISRQIEKNWFDQILFGHPACKIDVYADQAIRAEHCPRIWSMGIGFPNNQIDSAEGGSRRVRETADFAVTSYCWRIVKAGPSELGGPSLLSPLTCLPLEV